MELDIQEDFLARPDRPSESFFNRKIHPLVTQQTSLLRLLAVQIAQSISKKPTDVDEQEYISPYAAAVYAWFDGVEAITHILWPPAFLGMFAYDIYNYLHNPEYHYQMTLQNLLLGLPENFDYKNSALSINLGGDIASIHRLEYWPWSILLGSAIASGYLFQYLASRKNFSHFDEILETRPRELWDDLICSLPYISRNYWRLYHSGQTLLKKNYAVEPLNFDGALMNREIKDQYTSFSSSSPQFKRILTRITDSDLNSETSDQLENILQTQSYRSYFAKNTAVTQLARVAYLRRDDKLGAHALLELKKGGKDNLYARYKLWSIGGLKSWLFSLMGYTLIVPLQWYIKLRLWTLLVTKILRLADFLKNQQQCLQQTKGVWTYTEAIGNYACLPCELDFAAYRPNMTGQDCVDGLLSLARTPKQLMYSLSAVQNHGPFNNIDLHQQTWTNWTRNDWQNLLTLFGTSRFAEAPIFNLSRDISDSLAVAPDFLADLADYLQIAGVQNLDLSGQILSLQGMSALTPGFRNNSRLLSVAMSRSGLDDSILNEFIELIPGMSALNSLRVSSNQLTGFTLSALADVGQENSSLTHLDISNNLLTTVDIDSFPINATFLQNLDISGAVLSAGTLNYFCAPLANSSLISLTMNYCQISPSLASTLFACIALSNISRLSWEGNDLDYSGMQTLAGLLPVSHITELNLNNNNLDNDAVALLAAPLTTPNGTLVHLGLSGNLFTSVGFAAITAALNVSSLQSLSLSRVNLGDDSVTALAITAASQLPLTRLDLSSTSLSNSGASQLLFYLANSTLMDLDLSQNFLLGELGPPLLAIFNSSITRLNLRKTYVDGDDLQLAFTTLPDSKLEYLDISENDLGDQVAITLAEQLLFEVPNQQRYLRTITGDNDFSRALGRSTSNTRVKKIDWESDNRLTALGATSLCRVWPFAGNNNFNLTLSGENLNPALSGSAKMAATPSGLLISALLFMALQPNFSPGHLRVFNAVIGAGFTAVLGVPGVLGAALGYQLGGLFSTMGKKLKKVQAPAAPVFNF